MKNVKSEDELAAEFAVDVTELHLLIDKKIEKTDSMRNSLYNNLINSLKQNRLAIETYWENSLKIKIK